MLLIIPENCKHPKTFIYLIVPLGVDDDESAYCRFISVTYAKVFYIIAIFDLPLYTKIYKRRRKSINRQLPLRTTKILVTRFCCGELIGFQKKKLPFPPINALN